MAFAYITLDDGTMWTAEGIEGLRGTRDMLLKQRDAYRLQLDLLRGKIHMLDQQTQEETRAGL